MKSIFKLFIALAASLLAFNACQQEINPSETSGPTHRLTFVADAPVTKTTANIDKENGTVDYVWNEADENYFQVYEIDASGAYKAADEVLASLSEGKMTLMADFEGEAVAGSKYQALFNSEVKAVQTGNDETYDQLSDVLISEVVVLEDVEDEILELKFKRETAFAQMTIKGLTDGPVVMGVSVTATNDKILAAEYEVEAQSFAETGSSEIVLDPMSDVASGQAEVYFASVPVQDAALTVGAVTCDEDGNFVAAYEKSFAEGKSISFTRGDIRHFNIGMNNVTGVTLDLTKDETTTATSEKMSWEKTFVSVATIQAENKTAANNYYPGKGNTSTRFYSGNTLIFTPKLNVPIKEIVYTATTESYATALANSSWTNATASASGKTVTITPVDGTAAVSAIIGGTTGAESIVITYGVPVQPTAHSITIDSEIENGSVEANPDSDIMPGTEVTLTATPDDGYKFESWVVSTAGGEDVTVSDDKFLMPADDVTVSATFVVNASGENTYSISLNKDLYGVSAGNNGTEQSKTTSDGITVISGCLSSASSKTYYDSGHIRYYKDSYLKLRVPEGKVITSIVFTASGTWNGSTGISVNDGEFSDSDKKTWIGSASEVDFSFSAQCRASKIDVTVANGSSAVKYAISCAAVDGGTLSATPTKAEAEIEVTLTATPDDEYEFNNDWSVKDESQNSITVTDGKFIMPASAVSVTGSFTKKTYAITANNADHGSYTVTLDGDSVTSASKGDKIILTATPDDGYICDGWTVKETNSETAVSVSNNSFTMPGAAVTITTSFSEKAVVVYDHAGTEEDPYSVKDALKYIGTLGTATSEDDIYVKGKISSITEISTSYGNATYKIKDASGDSEMTVYRGKYLNGVNFTANDQIGINDEVVVTGKVKDHNGTKEFDAGNYIVSITYLRASANKTTGISAAGETVTITVDTNVEGWTVTSDNTAFEVGAKSGNTVPVVVSENTSETDGRTAHITVSANGVDNVVITLTQNKKPSGNIKQYTAIITVDNIDKAGSGSGYALYNGNHSVTATAADGTTKQMTFTSNAVMPGTSANAGKMQFQAEKGTITGKDWGTIESIEADEALTVTMDGGDFSVAKTTKGAGYYDSITIVFSAE